MTDRHAEQVAPVHQPGVVGSHQWVIEHLETRQLGTAADRALTVSLLRLRERVGLERYGTTLQPHGGRDNLRDAWEEALDLVVYLATAVREGEAVDGLLERATLLTLDLVAYARVVRGVSGH